MVDKVTATQDGLFLGLVVHYSENGPIRFARVELEDDVLDWQAMQNLTAYLARQVNRHLDREADLEQETLFE
uniref:Uncharacterized protein n=1 Tax=uncultured prokaryote TaxID=198431 RepID=A0A0H5PWQ7_9ZZZZ|nr:hypothetical protein [uncultured prokaryote]